MKTSVICFATVLATAAPWWAVQAEETAMPERGPIPFDVYDQNNDGYVTSEEFVDVRNQRISERARAGYPMRGIQEQGLATFEAFDRDGDGKLTREELQAGQLERLQKQRGSRGPGAGAGYRGGNR